MVPRYTLWVFQADWLTDHPVVIIGAFILIALVLAGRYLGRGQRGWAHFGAGQTPVLLTADRGYTQSLNCFWRMALM